MTFIAKLILNAILTSCFIYNSYISATPNAQCLQCICQASSGCKPNIRCHNAGAGQYFCGPYQISWAYWADAGKPGFTGFSNDFENCLIDRNCAEATVRGYMAKWASDCNGDGRIDCLDYGAIHKSGPTGCNQRWLLDSKYWNELTQCHKSSSTLSASSVSTITSSASAPLIPAPLRDIDNTNTIIEIPQPSLPRSTSNRHSSAISSTSFSFGPPKPASSPFGRSSFSSSSSSFSRHNFSHSEIEITEHVASNSYRNSIPTRPSSSFPSLPPLRPFRPLPSVSISNSFSSPTLPKFKPFSPNTVMIVETKPNQPSSNVRIESEVLVSSVSTLNRPTINLNPTLPEDCLNCLCQASSKCDLNKGCNGAYCGPFLLSWAYWADGGKPGDGIGYVPCATNRTCAGLAVQGYMNKWNKDCNQDGIIDCTDYALIHKLGPHGCGKLEALQGTDYWKGFTTCKGSSHSNYGVTSEGRILNSNIPSNGVVEILEEVSEPSVAPTPPSPQPPTTDNFARNSIRREVDESPSSSFSSSSSSGPNPSSFVPPVPSDSPSVVIVERNIVPAFSNQPSVSPTGVRPRNEVTFESDTSRVVAGNNDFGGNENPVHSLTNNREIDVQPQPPPLPLAPPPSPAVISRQLEKPEPKAELNFPPAHDDHTSSGNTILPQECLECICHASSKCSTTIGCSNGGSGKFICGPFQVDWEYWSKAGKPGNRADLSNLENFQMCLTNRECSDDTVRGYMERNGKHCNGDCECFAALHIGANNRSEQWFLDSQYYADFRSCNDFRR